MPLVSTGRADPTIGNFRLRSSEADLKLMTSMKKVINWNTMSKMGVRFGSAFVFCINDADMDHKAATVGRGPVRDRRSRFYTCELFFYSFSDAASAAVGFFARAACENCRRKWSAATTVVTDMCATRLRNRAKK